MPKKSLITYERLREVLLYCPETGVFTWKIDRTIKTKAGDIANCTAMHGYIFIGIDYAKYTAHRLAWFYMTGKWPTHQIDHVNCKREDNRWSNLREATQSMNNGNTRTPVTNTSGAKGVTWHKQANKWMAQIKVDQRHIHLGLFDDLDDAARAYADAAKKYFGEFARLR